MAVTSFIPTIWAVGLLQGLRTRLVSENFINHDYVGDVKSGGTVKINTLSDISVYDYNGTVTYSALSTVGQDLVINQKKAFSFEVDDLDAFQAASGGNLMTSGIDNATFNVRREKDADMFATMADGGTVIPDAISVYDGATAFEAIRKAKLKMDQLDIPDENRVMAIDAETESFLYANKVLGLNPQIGEDVLKNGRIGMLLGITLYRSNQLKTASGNTLCIATTPRFTTEASQIDTIEAMRLQNKFADGVRGLLVYGAKVTNPNGVVVLKVNHTAPTTGGGGTTG